jgi:hypothetical protein
MKGKTQRKHKTPSNGTRRKRGGVVKDDAVKKCYTAFTKINRQNTIRERNKTLSGIKHEIKRMSKKIARKSKKEDTDVLQKLKDDLAYQTKYYEVELKSPLNSYQKKQYCNPKCKNTVFEDGDPNKLPDGIKIRTYTSKKSKMYPDRFELEKMSLLQRRKRLFKNGKPPIDSKGFSVKLSNDEKEKLQKLGALSHCNEYYYDPTERYY